MTDQQPEDRPTPTTDAPPEQPGQPGEGQSEQQPRTYDDPVDDASDDSFPASDPPGWSDSTVTRNPDSA